MQELDVQSFHEKDEQVADTWPGITSTEYNPTKLLNITAEGRPIHIDDTVLTP